jgi:prepilin-type N-terminal cleavage/methylation domain-containing protein
MSGGKPFRGSGLSARAGRRAFTLIEVLVVVSVIAMLMVLLLPALHGARRQAKAVACQARLHQWAVMIHQYTSDHAGWLFYPQGTPQNDGEWYRALEPYYQRAHPDRLEMLYCPAKKFIPGEGWVKNAGYGINYWVYDSSRPLPPDGKTHPNLPLYWRHVDKARSPSTVPVLLDFRWMYGGGGGPHPTDEPPAFDGDSCGGWMSEFCDARHGSASNGFFMDWSVRKVGLKELWTLKWHRKYNTAGPWTKRGGALPEDWPRWMRKFKDY